MKTMNAKGRINDWLICAGLALLGLLIVSFYFSGTYINTGYPDWMYHAFRAQSLVQHGFVSWDSIWDNGISYWRGYQFIPAAITALTSIILHVSVTQAMVFLTVLIYTVFHPLLYLTLLRFGRSKTTSLLISALSFAFSGIWLLVGVYSALYSIIMLPILLILWRGTSKFSRVSYAFGVGISIYIHPLLALVMGGLWALTAFVRRNTLSSKQIVIEILIMLGTSFFYWYSLGLSDRAYMDTYQLSRDFIFAISGNLKFGYIYALIVPLCVFAFIFFSKEFTNYSKYLFWYSSFLYILIFINLKYDYLDFLNRYQLLRLGFFIGIVFLVVFAEFLDKLLKRLNVKIIPFVCVFVITLSVTQALIDSSAYGFSPAHEMADPVTQYILSGGNLSDTEIYIGDSTTSSYIHPNLRFVSGYNDQLLPQLSDLRLKKLLYEADPGYHVTPENVANVVNYSKGLGVGVLMLPTRSPYILPLIQSNEFSQDRVVKGPDFDITVLKATWKANQAAFIDSGQVQALTRPSVVGNDEALDAVVGQIAVIKDGSSIKVEFPAPDKLKLSFSPSAEQRHIYLSQSYSRHWNITGGKITRSTDGMMVITVPAGVSRIEMAHTWGLSIYIEAAILLGALIYLIFIAIKEKKYV